LVAIRHFSDCLRKRCWVLRLGNAVFVRKGWRLVCWEYVDSGQWTVGTFYVRALGEIRLVWLPLVHELLVFVTGSDSCAVGRLLSRLLCSRQTTCQTPVQPVDCLPDPPVQPADSLTSSCATCRLRPDPRAARRLHARPPCAAGRLLSRLLCRRQTTCQTPVQPADYLPDWCATCWLLATDLAAMIRLSVTLSCLLSWHDIVDCTLACMRLLETQRLLYVPLAIPFINLHVPTYYVYVFHMIAISNN
jgi:hypothetical protein